MREPTPEEEYELPSGPIDEVEARAAACVAPLGQVIAAFYELCPHTGSDADFVRGLVVRMRAAGLMSEFRLERLESIADLLDDVLQGEGEPVSLRWLEARIRDLDQQLERAHQKLEMRDV